MIAEPVWVYVISKEGGDILSKVGVSKHPEKRCAVLSREHKAPMRLAHIEGPYTRAAAFRIERTAHRVLELRRQFGEWFHCHENGAVSAIRAAVARTDGGRVNAL